MSPTTMLKHALLAMLLLFACAGAQAQTAARANPGGQSAKALVSNDAEFVNQAVPASMVPGGAYNVAVTMKNTGTATWPAGVAYLLGSQNPQDNTRWGGGRVALGAAVQPGGLATFSFQVTAPATPGTYGFQWRMVQEFVTWFGPQTPNVAVTVGSAAGGDIVTYIHTDALGSPVARSDAAGNIISRTRYEPYGGSAGGVTPTIGFTGHVNDSDTGLVYMQQRYYDPVAGRFLSVDPVVTDANTGGSFSRYNYAANNPYRYTDPDGRAARELSCPVKPPEQISTIGPVPKPVQGWHQQQAANLNQALQFGAPTGAGAAVIKGALSLFGTGAKAVTNPISSTLARVVPGSINPATLGRVGEADVFVTNAAEIHGLSAAQISEKLTIPGASSFRIIEFPSANVSGIASPINRLNPGFAGKGSTAGGASEFVIPNGPLPVGSVSKVVQ
jgi:RHS repeat-associated protein